MAHLSPNEIRYAETNLPTRFGLFRCIVYRFDGLEHVALVKGDVANRSAVLCRIHSECLTGEVFQSLRCDCKHQFDQAMSLIAEEDFGVLLYLRQEGRGIGLGNKIRAYHLQEGGVDTVDANRLLGFPDDGRDFYCALRMLRDLDIASIKLLTNNPSKVEALVNGGVHVVERLPLLFAEISSFAKDYLHAKSKRLGHVIGPLENADNNNWCGFFEHY
jgi:3,4-dihydroxy 2-butanone 4-phosphate synthase/GTP cyclohydrolase II